MSADSSAQGTLMRSHVRTRLFALVLPLVLAIGLVACDDQDAEEDPRGALRDAIMELRGYDGIELVIGAQLDEAARQSAMTEGDFDEDQLNLLVDSTLTIRGVSGEDDDDGRAEFQVVVGDESVATLRTLPDEQMYALIDLPAIERVAERLDAGADFQQSISQFEQMAGMFGLGDVVAAAREAEWIRVVGLDQMAQMAQEDTEGQPDEADLERLGREVGQRLLAFIEDDDVAVDHVGSEDAGERIRITAGGAELRELVADLFDALDDAAEVGDPTGMGMDPAQLREDLEQSIPDDTRLSFDAWVEGGELSQVAVDIFSVAREAGEEDVPDGEFLIAIGVAEFTGDIEAPETDVTFDAFEVFGGLFGGLGDLGDDQIADQAPPELDEDVCLTEDDVEQLRQQLPEEQRDLDDEELEALIGLPIC
jgi:hypothetical protein